jgi:hypothetical protein
VSSDHEHAATADYVINKPMTNLELIFEYTNRVADPSAPMGGIRIKTNTNWTFEKELPQIMTKLRPNESMVL